MPELPDLSDLSDLAVKGQGIVAKAVEVAMDTVKDPAPALGKMVDLVPTPGEVVDQVTATANELLVLGKDIQDKVITALTFNA